MSIIEQFFGLLAPHDCIMCGSEGHLLCIDCAGAKMKMIPERCYRCYRSSTESATCTICRHYSVLKHVWVRTTYTHPAKELIHELKFNYAKIAARRIAEEIAYVLPVLANDTIIVHAPAVTTHIRQRGFDQSALIARELSYITGLHHAHMLLRSGQHRQVGSSAKERHLQMAKAFRATDAAKGASILLVDDVLTTGSTLEAAALVLRQAGAKTVSAVVLAQT